MRKFFLRVKESIVGILVSLAFSFMLAFYEPFNMFVGNLEDFWFDIYDFLPIILLQFVASFLALSLFFIILNIISKKAYKVILFLFFVVTVLLYIQGNFLAYNLPGLAGDEIDWSKYGVDMAISCALWVVVAIIALVVLWKIKFEKFEKIISVVSVVITIMLVVGGASLVTKPHVFDNKNNEVAMLDNFNDKSKDKNFLIFLVDQVDSSAFNKELSDNWDKKKIFEDFTYYPNTTSTYLWTIFSVPYILSGEYYENKQDTFSDYFTSAIDNSKLFNRLEQEGYKMNIYEDEEFLNYKGDNLNRFENFKPGAVLKKKELAKQEAKYILYKYLPYPLKWIAKIENLDINKTKGSVSGNIYNSRNDEVYAQLNNEETKVRDDRYFSFVHVVGAHPPFVYDKNVNRQPEGTYEDGINSSIALVKKYLEKLKEAGVYDNSVIIVMSDHGNGDGDKTIERGNPILYIKGIDEKHDYQKSSKKISYENLNDAYMQLMDGDKTDELFEGLDNSKRRILYNELYNPNLKELMQTGDAWDVSTIVETGNTYPRG